MATTFGLRAAAFVLLLVFWVTWGWGTENHREEVPIRVQRGYLIVAPGSIGGAEKLNFLIDTGTVPTLVSRRLAQKLGLAGAEHEISIWGQRTRISLVKLPVLQLGSVRVENLQVFAIDMQPVEQELGMHLDAVLGLDALSPTSFTIDYARKVISFGVPSNKDLAIAMELRDSPAPYVVLPAEIEGKPVHLLLDTGAKGLTLLELRAQQLGLKTNPFAGSAGVDALIPIPLEQVRLGKRTFKVRNASLRRVPQDSLRDFDGFIGPTSIGIRRFGVDFAAKELYIEVQNPSK
jgi:predicted aspartyl protease